VANPTNLPPAQAANLSQAWQTLATDPATAQRLAQTLLNASPRHPEATLLLAAALRRQGKIEAAATALAPLARQSPNDAAIQFEWAQTLAATGDETTSIAALRRATKLRPDLHQAWQALGDLLLLEGEAPQAGSAYAQALRAATRNSDLLPAANAICEGRATTAEAALKSHIRQKGEDPAALLLLAEAALRTGRVREAEAVLAHCLHIAPDFPQATNSLAILYYLQGRFAEAAPLLAALIQNDPHNASLRKLLAACLTRFGAFEKSIPVYESLLAEYRAQPKIWLFLAHAQKTMGQTAQAEQSYRTCLSLAPHSGEAWLSLADIKTARLTADDVTAMRTALAVPGMPPTEKSRLNYALGAAFEQAGDYPASFNHYAAGARLRRQELHYNAKAASAALARTQALLTPEFFAARQNVGCPSPAPIFVLGLPRSGSTLVEQILASHPLVEGTSELEEIGAIAGDLAKSCPGAAYPAILATLPPATLAQLGERYLARTRMFRHQNRPFFIDKMPQNFAHIGLIHLILPNAKIIDISRAPMAAGWAMFKQYFQTGHEYSYNLTETGHAVRGYTAFMAHIAATLPGRVHRISYENLVANTEHEIRALLDYCALPFAPACLRFWETQRAIQTPSAQQVRRPVFNNAVNQWRHYEPFLAPLRAALET